MRSVWTSLLFPTRRFRQPSLCLQEMNQNAPSRAGCGGPALSVLLLPSVNFDYGETPVMASLSFLSFSHSLITRRGWCGGVDWELQTALFTHSWLFGLVGLRLQDTHTHVICIPCSHPCTLSAKANQHIEITIFMLRP